MASLLHITTKHTGKMEGFQSLSTTCLNNPLCQARRNNPELVCSHCYSATLQARRSNITPCFEENGRILSESIIPVEYLPRINATYFRFESFGDLINENHAINFINIAKKNPRTTFALWTKNPWFIASAINHGYAKPENLIIVQSSCRLNTIEKPMYDFIDKVFTVYDKKASESVNIQCGKNNCIDCLRCYTKTDEVEYINEKLK